MEPQDYSSPNTKIYLFDFSLECIKSIAFGAHMSIDNKKTILEKCKNSDIQFFQEIIIKDQIDDSGIEGTIEYLTIGKSKQIPFNRLFKMEPQLFCITKRQFRDYTHVKELNELSELPYYKGNEKTVKRLYTRLTKEYLKS